MERFNSKKNEVYRDEVGAGDRVIKHFSDAQRYNREVEMWDCLTESGVPVPERLSCNAKTLSATYRYIPGAPVVDLIERLPLPDADALIGKICAWMIRFYSAMEERKGESWILGDIHLRNFLYEKRSDTVYGIDLEECRPGRPESDIARLFVFILHYDPAYTQRKRRLAALLWDTLSTSMTLDPDFFQREVDRETAELNARRPKQMEEGTSQGSGQALLQEK